MPTKKIAIVLFNLGGPDSLEAVKPFLFNLFNDKAIIGAPNPIRWCLAKFISGRRAPLAREIYSEMGGRSPILEETRKQADKLTSLLCSQGDQVEYKSFIAMRYWHPFTEGAVEAVK
jgi:ferrochelatase